MKNGHQLMAFVVVAVWNEIESVEFNVNVVEYVEALKWSGLSDPSQLPSHLLLPHFKPQQKKTLVLRKLIWISDLKNRKRQINGNLIRSVLDLIESE